jgi:hypothetical protein
VLPEDARFCHKCGKPQREEPHLAAEIEAPPLPPPVVAPELPPIGFHNGTAVRIALFAGALAFLLSMLSGVFAVIWMVAGGFFSVYLYRKRTGQRLSVVSGAHLGWLSGIFGFVIATIVVTLVVVALSQPEVVEAAREQWKARSLSEADINQVIDLLRSPSGLATILSLSFLFFSLLPAVGGAVGAKLLGRD